MLLTRRSPLTGQLHTRIIPADPFQVYAYLDGADLRPVQVQFPHLSADDREFLITGVTPEEWAALDNTEEQF